MQTTVLYCIVIIYFITHTETVQSSRPSNRLKRSTFADILSFPLHNAAERDLHLPAMGIGTGFYNMEIQPYGAYPECGDEVHPNPAPSGPPEPGCGNNTQKVIYTWLSKAKGVRLDCANSYYNHRSVARGIEQSGVNRSQIFILSKVGPTFSLGYNDTLQQTHDILQDFQTDYIDLMLVHWPLQGHSAQAYIPVTTDPLCNISNSLTYDEKKCRLSTWSAMVSLFQRGILRSIGVSNYNITHLQEIIDAGLPLPAANQVSFHPYNYRTGRIELLDFCNKHNILLMGYSSLGVPDVHQFPTEDKNKQPTGLSPTLLEDPVIVSLAKQYNRTPVQILLNWSYQHGVPTNPRSMNETHMLENLDIFANPFTISDSDMNRINSLAQDTCDVDPDWYQCAGNGNLP